MSSRHQKSASASHRPDTQLRADSSSSNSNSIGPASPEAISPISTNSSSSANAQAAKESTSPSSSFPFFSARSITRSTTIDTFFHSHKRSRSSSSNGSGSGSPLPSSPPADIPSSPSSATTKPPTSPTTSRHKSESSVPTVTGDPRRSSSFFQKKPPQHGSLSHYGRHGDQWLFGGVSLTQTVKGVVVGRSSGSRHDGHEGKEQ